MPPKKAIKFKVKPKVEMEAKPKVKKPIKFKVVKKEEKKMPIPREDESIVITRNKTNSKVNDREAKEELIIDNVYRKTNDMGRGLVDIDFDDPQGLGIIGTADIKDLKKTKKGWSVPEDKVRNRDSAYWK